MSNKNKLISSGKTGSPAEDIFIDLFCDVFGPKNSQFLYLQYPFTDIYGGQRYLDFAIKSENEKIAIEIDGETFHNPKNISDNKYADDLLKQNSIIYDEWKIYRWTYNQLKNQPEKTKDEMTLFLGHMPQFKILDDFLPNQKGQSFELKDHQEDALKNLNTMREKGESIALLYHATGTGKTTTSVLDAKRMGLKTLFLAHRTQIIKQAKETFKNLWPDAHVGLYVGGIKEDGDVICASIQSITNDLHKFNPEDFGYIIIDEAHHAAAS